MACHDWCTINLDSQRIHTEHKLSVFRSQNSEVQCDILSSIPEDVACQVLECLSLPERLLASVTCKSWRRLCAAATTEIEIEARDIQQLIDSHAWLANIISGRQSLVKTLKMHCLDNRYKSTPFDWDREGPQNPFLALSLQGWHSASEWLTLFCSAQSIMTINSVINLDPLKPVFRVCKISIWFEQAINGLQCITKLLHPCHTSDNSNARTSPQSAMAFEHMFVTKQIVLVLQIALSCRIWESFQCINLVQLQVLCIFHASATCIGLTCSPPCSVVERLLHSAWITFTTWHISASWNIWYVFPGPHCFTQIRPCIWKFRSDCCCGVQLDLLVCNVVLWEFYWHRQMLDQSVRIGKWLTIYENRQLNWWLSVVDIAESIHSSCASCSQTVMYISLFKIYFSFCANMCHFNLWLRHMALAISYSNP